MKKEMDQWDQLLSDIYPTRYQAEKVRRKGEERVIKVEGGYRVVSYREYEIRKKQK